MDKNAWKESTNAKEIIETIINEDLDKIAVLRYFGAIAKNVKVVKGLLNSGFYTGEEILQAPGNYSRWDSECRKALQNFTDKGWQVLTDVEEIYNYPSPHTSAEDFCSKLRYFKKHNRKIYSELLQNYLIDGNDAAGRIFDGMIKHSDEFMKEIAYVVARSSELASHRPLSSNEKLTRVRLLAETSKRSERQADRWKKLKVPSSIMYLATEKNKWDILEYFASTNESIFNKIVAGYVTVIDVDRRVNYTRNEIIAKYDNENFNKLPMCLQKYIISLKQQILDMRLQEAERRDERAQAKLSWEDKDGNIVEFFSIGQITPKSKEDYLKVIEKFVNGDLTIPAFCRQYKISSADGFRRMLEKFSAESSYWAEQIRDKNAGNKTKYLHTAKDLIEGVCNDEIDVGSVVSKANVLNFEKMKKLSECAFNPELNYCETFVMKVAEYYYNRVNSYTKSIEPENIAKMLTRDEIKFIIGANNYESMLMGNRFNVDEEFKRITWILGKNHPEFVAEKICGIAQDGILTALKKYSTRFNKKFYLRSTTYIVAKSGEQIKITPEMVDMAYQFAQSKGIYTSDMVMNCLINSVANGKIQNQEQTKQDMNNMRAQAAGLIDEITDIDEYFDEIDKL